MKTIHIDIDTEGLVTVEALNFKGKGCADATEMIEVAIGGAAPKSRKMKPEAFVPSGGSICQRTF
jgi:hypothetical protein